MKRDLLAIFALLALGAGCTVNKSTVSTDNKASPPQAVAPPKESTEATSKPAGASGIPAGIEPSDVCP